jgi:hypothetical protein
MQSLVDGAKNAKIMELYEEEKVYLNMAMPKARYDAFRKSKVAH